MVGASYNMNKRFLIFLPFALLPAIAAAQSVSENWLRQAGITCGGGQSEETRSELESALLSQLEVLSESNAKTYKTEDVTMLLNQFSEQGRTDAYKAYSECVTEIMKLALASASNSGALPVRDIVLESPNVPAGLEVAKRGDRLILKPGESVAINDYSLIFTFREFYQNDPSEIVYGWSNSESGQGESNNVSKQGNNIIMGEKCVIVPYKIDAEVGVVSVIVNC
jgi:hypothetical protein